MKAKVQKLLDRIPAIPRYILSSFIPWLVLTAVLLGVLFAVLNFTGLYSTLENALDLKANSPWVITPLIVSAAGTVICFLLGSLMYFHKYKRSVVKTKFNRELSKVYSREQGREASHK